MTVAAAKGFQPTERWFEPEPLWQSLAAAVTGVGYHLLGFLYLYLFFTYTWSSEMMDVTGMSGRLSLLASLWRIWLCVLQPHPLLSTTAVAVFLFLDAWLIRFCAARRLQSTAFLWTAGVFGVQFLVVLWGIITFFLPFGIHDLVR